MKDIHNTLLKNILVINDIHYMLTLMKKELPKLWRQLLDKNKCEHYILMPI